MRARKTVVYARIHEDVSTRLTPPSRKRTVFRGALMLPQSNMKCTMCFPGFEVESFVDKLFGPMSRPRTQGADE